MKCDDCFWGLLEDEGYSNYTVENTTFTCILGKNPNGTFDRFYGEDKRLDFASQCPSFFPFPPLHIDVDREIWDKEQGYSKSPLYLDRLRGILAGIINPAKKWGNRRRLGL